MKTDTTQCVECPHCQGKGTIPIPRHLNETLNYLRERGERSAPQLKKALMPDSNGSSGMNNRLSALEEMGLVRCVRIDGKTKLWKANDPQPEVRPPDI